MLILIIHIFFHHGRYDVLDVIFMESLKYFKFCFLNVFHYETTKGSP